MLLRYLLFCLVFATIPAWGHLIPGIGSISKQLDRRDENLIDSIYQSLPIDDLGFIDAHLKNLTIDGSSCDKCKNKIRYGQSLIQEQPDKQYLISLLLFKYCMVLNKNKESKCDNVDFFITTSDKTSKGAVDKYDSGLHDSKSIDFYDNDFIHMLKLFNVSSDLDLEYYCYYKSDEACDLPETPDIDSLYNFEAKWPAKQPKHCLQPQYPSDTPEKFNVLHFTDFHFQSRYQIGSESNCTTALCCLPEAYNEDLNSKDYNFTDAYFKLNPSMQSRKDTEYSFYPEAHYEDREYIKGDYYDFPKTRGYNSNLLPATSFGGYLCDSPEVLINNSLKQMNEAYKEHKFEFALFTGDLVDHDVIHCDPETTKYEEIQTFSLMKHYLENIPVFPSLGNHDTFPYGQLSPIDYDYNNLYLWNVDLMSDLWISNGWLPENKSEQLKSHYAGFSTVTNRGLKVISLNSNCYYQKNLWSYVNLLQNADIFGQWQFLIDELIESEANNQRVWILAHIPSGDADTLPIQSKIFAKIVERFSPYTIANIFYGHTHRDQFQILYSSNSSDTKEIEDVINMSWVSQSITPLTDNNPSWRYYEVEDGSFNILNSYNYYTQLNDTFTNGGKEPNWKFEYSARDIYDPYGEWPTDSPLNATFWHKFVVTNLKNQSNIEFNQLYTDLQYRMSPNVPNCANGSVISQTCYEENWCDVSTFTSEEYLKCLQS